MGVTTLRVDQATKARFDELKRLVEEETGETVSQDALVERLLGFAQGRGAAFLKEQGGPWRRWTHEEADAFFENLTDPGIETDASRLDEELYGGEP